MNATNQPTLNLSDLIDEDDDTPFTLCSDPLRERRGRSVDKESKRFNEALWRIVNGKPDIGGLCAELSVLTGLSVSAIRSRINDVEYEPAPLECGAGLDSDDLKYFGKLYKNHKDPECREWFQKISGNQRKHPDRENARVRRQRIGNRLISISIDSSEN